MTPPPIRTITLAIGDPHPLDERAIARAAAILSGAAERARAAGYETQTTRIATRPLLADLAETPEAAIVRYAGALHGWCAAHDIAYCSLGPAPAEDPAFALTRVALLPELLAPHPALSAAVRLATEKRPPRLAAALATARAMADLAERTAGDGNFRFAALALCPPGGPFFPQAYAAPGAWSLAVGLQGAGVVREALAALASARAAGTVTLADVSGAVARAVEDAARPVVALLAEAARAGGLAFGGIDLSPAPLGADSIAGAFEALGMGRFGEPGTLALAAAITAALRAVALPCCGYCGLMLPVLEDAVLGQRCAEGLVSLQTLIAYSAVCGTGLDTVPLPGATPPERIAAVLLDVATLAHRLRKPLAARLFLVPGGLAGELTTFSSPYLTNTRILPPV